MAKSLVEELKKNGWTVFRIEKEKDDDPDLLAITPNKRVALLIFVSDKKDDFQKKNRVADALVDRVGALFGTAVVEESSTTEFTSFLNFIDAVGVKDVVDRVKRKISQED